jgi:hypothetical protein
MRMGLSRLNAYRNKYNFITYSNCPLCGLKPEDSIHYFLKCPYLAIPRQRLIEALEPLLVPHTPGITLIPTTRQEYKKLNDIFSNGSSELSLDINIEVFRLIHSFIIATKRFDID